MRGTLLLSSLCFLAFGVSCSDDGDPIGEIDFAAMVGSEPVTCGGTYDGLGADGASLEVRDFRFYVHDVRLVDAGGAEVPFVLEDDGMWQDGDVALLDFENGCGEMGNAELNTTLVGRAPAGEYTGIRFKMGVPAELNHQNPPDAAPPLSLSELFWNWNGGYKFVRIEGPSSAFDGWRFHLGSTRCTGDMMGNATCSDLNVVDVALDGFDPLSGTVIADLEGLVEGSGLGNVGEPMPGCMATPGDADCAPLFANLGLAFDGVPAPGDQTFFRAEP